MFLQQASTYSVSSLQSRALPAAATLRPCLGLIRRSQSHRQTRAFRIGFWSSYLDPASQKEARKRQRNMKRKYAEAINRKLLWDRRSPSVNHSSIKSFMCSAWNGSDRRPGGRWIDLDGVGSFKETNQNTTGTFESTPQSSINQMLRTHNDIIDEMVRTKARIFGSVWHDAMSLKPSDSSRRKGPGRANESSVDNGAQSSMLNASSSPDLGYVIDPITNRKVFRNKPSSPTEVFRKALNISDTASKAIVTQLHNVNPFSLDPARESLKDYENKGNEKYSPVYYKEPDGKDPEPLCTVTAGLKEYDEKSSYTPVYYKEPDGKDPVQICSVQQALSEYDSKVSYGPVFYKEPDGRDPEKVCTVLNGLKDFDTKTSYGPVYYNEPDGKFPENECGVQKGLREYDNKITYGPLLYREPDGKLPEEPCQVQSALADFDKKANYGPSKSSTQLASAKIRRPLPEETVEDIDLLRASDVRASSGLTKKPKKETDLEKASNRKLLEEDFQNNKQKFVESLEIDRSELLNHIAHARSRVNAKIAELDADLASPKPPKLTGNFVRDFPEDFRATWSSANSGSGALVPNKSKGLGKSVQEENSTVQQIEGNHAGSQIDRIQPALDRDSPLPRASAQEPLKIEEQRRKNSDRARHRDFVREIRQIYEDQYGTIDQNHRQVAPSKAASETRLSPTDTETPSFYKILAYDPTMQSISEADTTSIVNDSASPLTPAEVLLRLSNPAKFFPHFAQLQKQGFEIVTGGGDVLVFRKVRDGSPLLPREQHISDISKRTRSRGLNPIDGMQPVAATGNFASPTGFVNHDLPEEDLDQTEARTQFKSNIDVRREEPVFSGRRSWQQNEESQKSTGGRAKRIVLGAFWVGAISYTIGVVAQFAKTV